MKPLITAFVKKKNSCTLNDEANNFKIFQKNASKFPQNVLFLKYLHYEMYSAIYTDERKLSLRKRDFAIRDPSGKQ